MNTSDSMISGNGPPFLVSAMSQRIIFSLQKWHAVFAHVNMKWEGWRRYT